ncbi:MAG: LysR family transcriptional regulator [Comamonas sp.]
MRDQALFDKIDLHLIRVLHTVLTERSVSRAALRLGMYQPAVSAALKRLRTLAGDPLLVRSGSGMMPTEVGQRMVEPAAAILRAAESLFSDVRSFDPRTATRTFRIAASDYFDPRFLPAVVARIKAEAPMCSIEVFPLSPETDYHDQLANGDIDVVVGNWLQPTDDLHMTPLMSDEVVCLASTRHPAVRRGWDVASWLEAEHIAPTATHPGARGIIDAHLDAMGLQRRIMARCAHFSAIPAMCASTLLVLTTGRQFCERFTGQLPLTILPCPVDLPPLDYYLLWHARTQVSDAASWLRDVLKKSAQTLRDAD